MKEEIKKNVNENDANNDVLEYKVNKKQNMSKFEKIFWSTIVVLFIIYLGFTFLANKNMQVASLVQNTQEPVSKDIFKTVIQEIEVIVPDNTIVENLKNPEILVKIKNNLTSELHSLDIKINTQVDQAFSPVYTNIDTFLDFHYSVIGEYTELTAAVTGELGNTIKERLFGENFETYLTEAKQDIDVIYQSSVKKHFEEIDKQALNRVDKQLNVKVLQILSEDIKLRFELQGVKLGVLILSKIVAKIVSKVSTKIITKASAKMAAKLAAKATAKSAAAGTGATLGLTCGPAAWICSPLAAGALWIATDIAIVSGDEYLNRDDFKQEIISMIDKQKLAFSQKMKKVYFENFKEQSEKLILEYKSTVVTKKVKKRVKIKDIMKQNF